MPLTRRELFDSLVPSLISQVMGDQAPDAQGLAFMTSALYSYETQVYTPRRWPLIYQRLIPIDTSDGEGAIGRVYYVMDTRGSVKEIARGSDDLPTSDLAGGEALIHFKLGGGSYIYDTEDLRQAALLKFDRVRMLPQVAFDNYEIYLNEHALYGCQRWGTLGFPTGLLNHPGLLTVQSDKPFSEMNADEMIEFFSIPLDTLYTATRGGHVNTIAAPNYMLSRMQRTRIGDCSDETVASFLARVNKTTLETGEPLEFVGVPGLEHANPQGGPRVMFYDRSPENVMLPLPMPYRFMPPQVRNLTFVVPGEFKYGPVYFRYPNSAMYVDGPPDPEVLKIEEQREQLRQKMYKAQAGVSKALAGVSEAQGKVVEAQRAVTEAQSEGGKIELPAATSHSVAATPHSTQGQPPPVRPTTAPGKEHETPHKPAR